MGDFEDVFGAGADADAIMDGFSRSAMVEICEERKDWDRWAAHVYLLARIEACGYSLYLEDCEAVIAFDRVARHYSGSSFGFAGIPFTRVREGAGFRVIVDRASYQTYFTRPGRIVVTGSPDEAEAFVAQSAALVSVFKITTTFGSSNEWSSPIMECEQDDGNLNEMAPKLFERCGDGRSDPNLSIFDLLDVGQDVAVYGTHLGIILGMRARFAGWSSGNGLRSIFDDISRNSYRFTPPRPRVQRQ